TLQVLDTNLSYADAISQVSSWLRSQSQETSILWFHRLENLTQLQFTAGCGFGILAVNFGIRDAWSFEVCVKVKCSFRLKANKF
ncbi:hypothetical protein ACQP3J_32485, partial [Escherichia coli]